MSIGQFGGGNHLFIRGVQFSVPNILHHRAGEQMGVLQHDPQRTTQIVFFDLVDIDAVITDLAVLNAVKPVDQIGDGGLARPGGTHESDLLSRLGVQHDIVENHLFVRVPEIHMVKHHIPFQFRVSHGIRILMVMLPGPETGALRGFLDLLKVIPPGIDQFHIALIHLRFLVHQPEDSFRAGQCHNNAVKLHGNLVDRHAERPVQGQERRQISQAQPGDPGEGQHAADHRTHHITQIPQLCVHGAHDVGKLIGPVSAVTQSVVQFVELLQTLLLVAENLNHLLARHGFLNAAVQLSQIPLLGQEKPAGQGTHLFGRQYHHRHHGQRHQGEGNIQHQHGNQGCHHTDGTVEQLGQALTDHLPHGVNIVGVDGHDISVGMGIKISDGKFLHLPEQIIPQIFHGALGHIDHEPGLGEGRQHPQPVKTGHPADGSRQRTEIRILCPQQRHDIVINQRAHEQSSLQSRQYGSHNTHHHHDPVEGIVLKCIAQHPLKQPAGILNLGPGASGASVSGTMAMASSIIGALPPFGLSLLCHDYIPPFSSKSPLPPVWDS